MRVLAITNIYPTAKAPASGSFVKQQSESLAKIGLDVDVLQVERIDRGMGVYFGLKSLTHRRINSLQPDVVHVMYGGVMADQVTRAVKDRPVVVSFCGSDLLGEMLSGVLRRAISGYGVMCSHWAAKRATGIVVKSKNLLDALPYDVNRTKVRIIPNGVDLERFKPLDRDTCRNRLGWSADRFHILFPANGGDPVKRCDLASAAVQAVICSGIQAEMHQLRGVPHNEVPVWLNASDVVLLTSLHEGSPNIVKETLACNTPVVSVDVGDVRERILGIEGCYLSTADPNDLANKLSLVHAGPRRVEGRIKMRELSLEHVALLLKQFYREVLLSWK